jgi:hypothetical protein
MISFHLPVAVKDIIKKAEIFHAHITRKIYDIIQIFFVPVNISIHSNETTVAASVPTNATKVKTNETLTDISDRVDLSGPGVVKRGVIVFGGFALLAVAYFIFYR